MKFMTSIREKAKDINFKDDEFNEQYLHSKKQIDILKSKINQLENIQVNNHKLKEKIINIKDYIVNKSNEVVTSLFKTIFNLIIAKTRDDVVFVIDLKTPLEDLISNMDAILEKNSIITKTYFDDHLRKNIRYEVIINE